MHRQRSTSLAFYKMHGIGNDFVVLNAIANPLAAETDWPELARALCDRHRGVGGDGLLLLTPPVSPGAAIGKRMWNPDGSEDMCGNGLRCIVRLAHDLGHVTSSRFVVDTLSGPRPAEILEDGRIRVGMGQPSFEPSEIPIRAELLGSSSPLDYRVTLGGSELRCSTLSTGTTHTVVWLDEPLADDRFAALSPLLETDERFPTHTSIMWASVRGRTDVDIRIWERGGCGETLACGTGACATAVAAILTGRSERAVRVHSRGGTLETEWSEGAEISMTGGAEMVYHGKYSFR